jgi:Cep192 domain 4/Subtilase family
MKKTILTLIALSFVSAPAFLFGRQIPTRGLQQIQALIQEKRRLTPAQRKLDTHLEWASQLAHGRMTAQQIPSRANLARLLRRDVRQRVEVDIQGRVTDGVLKQIAALGGTVESSFPQYRAIRAWMPLMQVESLAGEADVNFIKPAERPILNDGPVEGTDSREFLRSHISGLLKRSHTIPIPATPESAITNTAPVDTDARVSHGVDLVAGMGITGAGIKVGVLSNGVDSLATLQGAGNLPNNVTVISGQAGSGDEGTAMLEIVYDLAPGAQLFFATGDGGMGQMAANIEALQLAGCNIIVDDLTYQTEGVFQDGVIAQAINSVTSKGALYFSSAANSGNLDSGTSGTWEGDFDGTGASIADVNTAEGGGTYPTHKFDSSHNYDQVTKASAYQSFLQWSDPLGASCNDYDLFVLDSSVTTVLDASLNGQNCAIDPYEAVSAPNLNEVLVIALYSGSPRAFHLDTERGKLAINTSGSTFGHNAGASTVTVAATPASTSIFTSGTQSPENYSSDGPRRIFYYPFGTPVTPGNFLFGTNGGMSLSKVDLTAADCGQSAVTGFNGPTGFCGTSAAAPTAAAIAALVWSASPAFSSDEVLAAMKNTALPAHSGFNTRTVGVGIVMANLAVNAALVSDASLSPASVFFGNQPAGSNSPSRDVTLSSTGTTSLTINNYSISGGNAGDFNIQSTTCGGSLAAADSCTFSVRFNPTVTGPRKTYLVISDNSAAATHKTLLTGVGTATMVSPASLTFADRTVDTTSSAQVVTIQNNSSSLLNLWQIRIGGTNAGDFSKTTTCGATLAVSASCIVSVSFTPTATGARAATLLFSDDGADSPQSVSLSGNGL